MLPNLCMIDREVSSKRLSVRSLDWAHQAVLDVLPSHRIVRKGIHVWRRESVDLLRVSRGYEEQDIGTRED